MEQYLPSEQSTQDSRQQGHRSPATSGKSSPLQAIAGNPFADSPRQAAQRQARDRLHDTPRQTAQRQRLDNLGQPSSERVQGKAAPAGGLPEKLKSGIESLSGISMDPVRVHYNSTKPAQLNALAYAQGTDIHLGPGQEKHLPHEAWHVVQQKQGRVKAPTRGDQPGVLQGKFAKKEGVYFTVEELMSRATISKLPDKIFVQYIYGLAADETEHEHDGGKFFNLDKIVKFAKEKYEKDFSFGKSGFDYAGYGEFLGETAKHKDNWSEFVDGQIEKAKARVEILKKKAKVDPVHLNKFDHIVSTAKHSSLLPAHELDNSAKFAERMHGEKVNPQDSVLSQPKIIQESVHSVWADVVWLEKKYTGEDTASMTPIPLIPVWGGTTSSGVGTFVSAAYQPNTTYQKGSTPEGIVTPYERVHTDRGVDWTGNTKFFIKGHLLNDHIGGPGQLYNLVPIGGHNTDEPATHSNWLHLFTVEHSAKSNIETMQKARYRPPFIGQIVRVEYFVSASPPSARDGTQIVRFVADNWPGWISNYKSEVQNREPTILELLNFVKGKSTAFHEILDVVRAVEFESELNYSANNAATISKKLQGNARLWSLEDAVIPSGLTWQLHVKTRTDVDDNHLKTETGTGTVPSRKPARLSTRYLGD